MTPHAHLRARLTREGWYYLAVLSFIVGGAALCHVNLLVILGGMMLAPLLINWRLALACMRGLTIRRRPIRSVHAGQPLIVEFEITNRRSCLAAWMVAVEDHWQREDVDWFLANRHGWMIIRAWLWNLIAPPAITKATAFVPCIEPGETARLNYELLMSRRGNYSLARFGVRSCFPLGLVEAVVTIHDPREVLIQPRIGRLSAEWTQRIAAAVSGEGERQLRHRAGDGEFFAVRPWQTGDSTRWMHWRTTARAGRPMVRQFERESTATVALILDPYLPAESTAGDRARFEAAISFLVTALADLAQRDVSRLAVGVANAEQQLWIGSRSPVFLEEVNRELAQVRGVAADHRLEIEELLEQQLAEAACVLVISSRPVKEMNASESAFAGTHTISVASLEFATLYSIE
jgi:uncharacterized protein (DUF58 family)